MISSKRFESVDGVTSRFLSDFIIQSEQHCRVYMYKYNPSCAIGATCDTIVGGVYIREIDAPQSADLVTLEKWDLVDNSIVFYITPSAGVTIVIEVATTPEEFGNVVAMPIVALAESYATSAGLSATSATASALTATTQAGIATTQAGISTTKATEALGSATIASNKATDASNSAITSLAQAGIATVKAAEATADVVLTNADVLLTHADVILTHADAATSTTQAGIATTKAGEASTSAAAALVSETSAAASAASLIIDAIPTNGSTNAVSSNGTFDALAGKQDTLTIDAAATDGSTNPIQSNAVFDGLALKLNLAGGTMTGAITAIAETKVAMGANDIALASGNVFTKTISGATTLTISGWLSSGNANSFILELTNGGSAVVTWFAGVKWAGGTAPTLTAAGVDILGFYSHDGGTTVRGIVLAKDSK